MSRRRELGQSLVEFALMAPLFMLLVLATIDGARAVFAYNTIANAAREGARYGIVHGAASSSPIGPGANETGIVTYVGQFTRSFPAQDVAVTPTWPQGSNADGSPVAVQVTYQYRPLFGGLIGIGPMTLQASSTMVIVH
ncbi:MAG: TadE/TadG family type IV pilus assembly protein [Dehalococcoidia bacterium]